MKAFADGCKKNGVEFIVIGDTKTPNHFQLDGCRFVSIAEQRTLPFKLTKLLPEKHYGRKNLGYLLSKHREVIIETDDDNLPKEIFWNKTFDHKEVRMIEEKGWMNVYQLFSKENIWPRGFPLEEIQGSRIKRGNSVTSNLKPQTPNLQILQGLADENPDVDAVYRMTSKLPVSFEKNSPVVLGKSVWCPFNSQNTVWKKEAFPLMYLPSYCSFRMTDIWRSFIAQRIAWTCDWNILFHSADVWQERNEHDLLKDFEDEVPGYLNNSRICKTLEELDLKSGTENICENLIRCYQLMDENGWVGKEEMKLVDAWCGEF